MPQLSGSRAAGGGGLVLSYVSKQALHCRFRAVCNLQGG